MSESLNRIIHIAKRLAALEEESQKLVEEALFLMRSYRNEHGAIFSELDRELIDAEEAHYQEEQAYLADLSNREEQELRDAFVANLPETEF